MKGSVAFVGIAWVLWLALAGCSEDPELVDYRASVGRRVCGDGICQETCGECPEDCGSCSAAHCGDNVCASGETCDSCRADCGRCRGGGKDKCGNGECSAKESCESCPTDCGTCDPACGDGVCDTAEDCTSCASDCGICPPACGDGVCDTAEDCTSCASDCGQCQSTVCDEAPCTNADGCCPATCNATTDDDCVPGPGSGGGGGAVGTRTDYPCNGCITTVPPTYDPSRAIPVLISLHGDEGDPGISHGFWYQAAIDNGYLLLAPKCPAELGCTGSWGTGSWHPNGRSGSIEWILTQLDRVESDYNVDLTRVYLTGGSGGAVYVGYHADAFVPRIAGVSMVSGGYKSITSTCPSCSPLPVYILVGDQDYLLGLAELARDWFASCVSDMVYDLLPGVDHQGGGEALRSGKGDEILQFFNERPNTCYP